MLFLLINYLLIVSSTNPFPFADNEFFQYVLADMARLNPEATSKALKEICEESAKTNPTVNGFLEDTNSKLNVLNSLAAEMKNDKVILDFKLEELEKLESSMFIDIIAMNENALKEKKIQRDEISKEIKALKEQLLAKKNKHEELKNECQNEFDSEMEKMYKL